MLAKRTSRNRITLPKAALRDFAGVEHFDVTVGGGRVVLTPLPTGTASAARAKLAALEMTAADVRKAVQWSRARRR